MNSKPSNIKFINAGKRKKKKKELSFFFKNHIPERIRKINIQLGNRYPHIINTTPLLRKKELKRDINFHTKLNFVTSKCILCFIISEILLNIGNIFQFIQ